VIVNVHSRQSDLLIDHQSAIDLIESVLSFKGIQTDLVNLYFIDEKTTCEMHSEYFDDASITDCMTFPIDGLEPSETDTHILGDIFVCPKMALIYSKEHQSNPYDEVSLYIIHGLLHLLGFDDMTEEDSSIMRNQEKLCLSLNLRVKK